MNNMGSRYEYTTTFLLLFLFYCPMVVFAVSKPNKPWKVHGNQSRRRIEYYAGWHQQHSRRLAGASIHL